MIEVDAAAQQPQTVGGVLPAPDTAQEPAPMLDVHAPHKAISTWTDFFVHIATIVIGLLIAVALEQTVEFFHHRQQRLQLQEQMHDVLVTDIQMAATDVVRLNSWRSYLSDLQDAIAARAQGQPTPSAPGANDEPPVAVMGSPGLAPYEASQENGTVALLPSGEIRLYNRVSFQFSLMRAAMDRWGESLQAVNAFDRRFNHSADDFPIFKIERVPALDKLSPAELAEYKALVGTLTNETDVLKERMHIITTECQAILDGARDENDLIKAVARTLIPGSGVRPSPSPGK